MLPPLEDELLTCRRLGIDEFILAGFPHLNESIRVSQEIIPRLRATMAQAEPSIKHAKS